MGGISLAGRDVLRLLDLAVDEFAYVLDTATAQKSAWAGGDHSTALAGKAIAVILEKPSLRTRVSFEVGIGRLGAQPVVMADANSAFSREETVHDTVKVLERYVDMIVMRTFAQERIEEVAHHASIPVINALTDDFHPCQGIADLLTIREHKGRLAGLTLAYVGDGNNMANTYLEAGALSGMHVRIASPNGYTVSPEVVAECQSVAEMTGGSIVLTDDPAAAVAGADVVITDTWASMGDEAEHAERAVAFEAYQVNVALMEQAADDALFLHCLPAHRREEVTDEVMDGRWSVIFDEAENRLHGQKALMSLLLAP